MPTVSVVTPVHNGMAYFGRAIPSILAQSYEDFEFIIVDDGSTDGTLEQLREIKDPRVKIHSPGRIGFARACNWGIAHAEGQYIARQDFDDVSYPERLTLQVARLERDRTIDLVGGHTVSVTSGGRFVRQLPTEHEDIVQAMAQYIPLAHTAVMLRRQAWADVRGYPDVRNIVDLRMWLRMAKRGWRFANLPEVIGEHHIHESSWFNQTFRRGRRQRELAWVQVQFIWSLGLAPWLYLYPLGRFGLASTGLNSMRALFQERQLAPVP